jgi:hypothetical protein
MGAITSSYKVKNIVVLVFDTRKNCGVTKFIAMMLYNVGRSKSN